MRRRVIIIVHGINTTVEETRWMHSLKAYLDRRIREKPHVHDIEVLIHQYNPFAWGYFTIVGRYLSTFLPTMASPSWRNKQVEKFQEYVSQVREDYDGEGLDIDIVAHSFGAFKTYYSMLNYSKQPKAFYRKLILVGAAISSRIKYEETPGHYEELHAFYSEGDDVIAKSPIGNLGWAGPYVHYGPHIYGHDYTPFDHDDYWAPENTEKVHDHIADILDL